MKINQKKRGIAIKKGAALGLGLLLAFQPPEPALLQSLPLNPVAEAYAYTERSATIKATSLNIRSDAGTGYSAVARLPYGTAVTVIGEKTASDGVLWYQVRFVGSGGATQTGYASGQYIKFPVTYTADSNFEAYLNAQGFPESYRQGLRELHAQYPNWVFIAQHTGVDWNSAIENESVITRNLVASSSISSWKSTQAGAYNWDTSTWNGFDGASWVQASPDIIRYYMDPRNFLNEKYIFQFLLQSYNASAHTAAGLESMVKGTFLESNASGTVSSGGNTGGTPGGTGGPGGSASGGSQEFGPGTALSSPGGTAGNSGQTVEKGPGGGNVTVVPESSNTGSSGQNSGVSFEAPGVRGGTNPDVSLVGPQASISPKKTALLGEIGPGMDLEGSGSGGAVSMGSQGPGSPSSGGGSGSTPSSGSRSYVDIIMDAGVQSGVNPYVLAAMIIQEQGNAGTSPMISGQVSGYEGIYNFFNVEAYETSSMSKVAKGLSYAAQSGSYSRPWNSVEKSIIGGSVNYGDNYVKAGQDTFYLKKFNVQGSNMYKHQYMTNVQGAASEGAKMAEAYTDAVKQTALEFKIPVYKNMPEQACARPTGDGNPNNKLSSLGVSGFSMTPVFSKDITSYDVIVNSSVNTVNIQASALSGNASVSGTGNIALNGGTTEARIRVQAQNGSVQEYIIRIVRSGSGPMPDAGLNGGGSQGTAGPGPGTSGSSVLPAGESGGPGVSGGNLQGPGGSGSGELMAGNTDGPGGSSVTVIN